MGTSQTELSYRRVALQEASTAGLMVVLYDMLAGDLRQAMEAMRSAKIEDRSTRLKHALALLQLLEGSLDMENGGIAARHLAQFYSRVRSQILVAQFNRSAAILQKQIDLILDVREAWLQVDSRAAVTETAGCSTASGFPESGTPEMTTTDGHAWSA
jgi:flagellar secretion chaperone FliS